MIILDADDLKDAKLTLFLILVNIIFYFFFNIALSVEYLLLFVQINKNILINYEIWRLITPIFLHADLLHLFSNMFALLIFGATIETNTKISKVQYISVYIISGVIGNVFSLFLLPIDSISLGASGAIFGLIGMIIIMVGTEDRSLLPFALIYAIFYITTSFMPGVNIWAHIAGLFGGLLFGYLVYYRKNRDYISNL
ncbi:MAG: rhomboid family intramembrane serine protease [Promethearchaeota archaeon]